MVNVDDPDGLGSHRRGSLHTADMEDFDSYDACYSELGHWLKTESRCFGDKGDVEDITEG